MADPLSVAAGVVGIVVPAMHGARLLMNDLDRIINAPEAVAGLRQDAQALNTNLELLQAIPEADWTLLGSGVVSSSKASIESCSSVCNTIRDDLQRWTKRSKGGGLSWQDRVNVGFFKNHQLKAHSAQLQTYKLTLGSLVGTATLYGSLHNSHMTDELRQTIISQHAVTETASHTVESELAHVDRALAEVRLAPADNSTVDEDEQDVTVLSLEELKETIQASRSLLLELLAKTQEREVVNAAERSEGTNITFGAHNSGNQWGVVHGSITFNGNR